MADLHPLYVHGDAIWRAVLATAPLLGMLALRARRARRLARAALPRSSALPAPVALHDVRDRAPVDVCLSGVLRGPRGARAFTWSDTEARDADPPLTLRTGGVDLPITGPIDVLVGARESEPTHASLLARSLRLPLPSSVQPSDTAPRAARLVRPGDRVRVHARLVRAPDPSGYRDARAALVLEPLSQTRTIVIAAERAPSPIAIPFPTWVTAALLGFFTALVLLFGGGALALAVARPATPHDDDGLRLSASALAAATPLRHKALTTLASTLLIDPTDAPPNPARTERAVRVLAMTGQHQLLAELLMKRGDLEEAAEWLITHDITPPGDLAFATGWFEHASRAYSYATPTTLRTLLQAAEAHLVARDWSRSAAAVRAYAKASRDDAKDRLQALECLADSLLLRDDRTRAKPRSIPPLQDRGRAVCTLLAADLAPPDERRAILGNLDFVWGDAQGMEFAKLVVNRAGQALLEEIGARDQLSTDVYRYGLYPDAYLEKNRPKDPWGAYAGIFEMGNDVAGAQRHERFFLTEHPWAILAAMAAKGRGGPSDHVEVRLHLVGHTALFLAMTGDEPGALGLLARVADVPDMPSAAPYWTRPTVKSIESAVRALAHERPYRLKGSLGAALDATFDRAQQNRAPDSPAGKTLARFRRAYLDREIAVPLLLLEAFARR